MTTLLARLEAATGPDRELDAEIVFDAFAVPTGKHKIDGGPVGYLWPQDDPSWALGIRFPGQTRDWFREIRKDRPSLVIERDGALVLMNDARVRPYTASVDAALSWMPEGWVLRSIARNEAEDYWAVISPAHKPNDRERGCHEKIPLALCIAIAKARGIA